MKDKEKQSAERSWGFFKPKHIKEGKLLLKGVGKFVRYNRDLISPEDGKKVEVIEGEFREILERPEVTKDELNDAAVKLTEACERSVPSYKSSMLKENLEVIFVAVVIAMGIRAYFVQPFKIPTGSMQPTLNGIIAYPHKNSDPVNGVEYTEPGRLGQIWEKLYYGRSYINLVSAGDDTILLSEMKAVKFMKFFTRTEIPCRSGRIYTVSGPVEKIRSDLITNAVNRNPVVKKGQVIARGFIDTGDQVLVDKMSYHWRKPKRGEVFVFVTRGIRGIEGGGSFDPRFGSQHYIKRLAGVPGDKLKVEPPNLLIDGELASEEGFRKVMSRENGYGGYTNGVRYDLEFDLGPEEYVALGDNSANSFDSRGWGVVPRDNVVGRALYVYLPLGHHWGKIR